MKRLTADEWQLAQQVCTGQQRQALDYWRNGYGYKRISVVLGISRDAARGRIERGLATVNRARYTRRSEAA